VLFTEPIWLSILIPIFFALVLLIASLVVRHWRRAGFDKAAFLSTGGLALAFVTGGALFAAVLVGFVLFTHWIAFVIERAAGSGNRHAPPLWRARVWLVIAVADAGARLAGAVRPAALLRAQRL
jgi:hypothetical protein